MTSVSIVALVHPRSPIGVKLGRIAAGLTREGHTAQVLLGQPRSRRSMSALAGCIDESDADILFVRAGYWVPALWPALRRARRRGCRLLLEVPTPYDVAVREALKGNFSWREVVARLSALIVEVPAWRLFDRIIVYAPESRVFSLGIGSRMELISNGVDTQALPLARRNPSVGTVHLIAVGSISYWHGWDRLVAGLATYHASRQAHEVAVRLSVVGDGAALPSLKQQVRDTGLGDQVTFQGWLFGADLNDAFDGADVGIGTLASHRKKLKVVSSIKSREYCARGLPFLSSDNDRTFNSANFVFHLPGDDRSVDIRQVLVWLESVRRQADLAVRMRAFAAEHCDVGKIYARQVELVSRK